MEEVYIDPLTPRYYLTAVERSEQPKHRLINWTCLFCYHVNSHMDNALVSCRKCEKNGITEDGFLKSQGGIPGDHELNRKFEEFSKVANKYSWK